MAKSSARERASVFAVAAEMEVPLREAMILLGALERVGQGLVAQCQPEDGEPVALLAQEATQRLEIVRHHWRALADGKSAKYPSFRG